MSGLVKRAGLFTAVGTGEQAAAMMAGDAYARGVLAGATPRYFRKRTMGGRRYLAVIAAGGISWALWMSLFLGFSLALIAGAAAYAAATAVYVLTTTSMRLMVSDRAIHRQQGLLREIPLDRIEEVRIEPWRFHLDRAGWYEPGTGRSVVVCYRDDRGRRRTARFDVDDPERFVGALGRQVAR